VMFGAAVWIFQEGALSGLLGFTPLGFLELSLPVLMFCLAFGLSMDYGVFMLSRTKEEHDRGRGHLDAIAVGLARTGGLITAAALVLSIVLFAMGAARVTNIQLLGVGVGLAVLVDATLVRCLLVPAVLAWTGPATWWAPGPLRRFHQRFGLREEAAVAHAPAPEAREPAVVR
jgi:RND superfamily putative drug exporter